MQAGCQTFEPMASMSFSLNEAAPLILDCHKSHPTAFAKAAFETYVAQWNKLRDVAMDTAKAASEPIQARVKAFIQLSHAA